MAFYAAVVSVVQLLDEISHRDLYRILRLGKRTVMKSLHEKFSLLQALLEDYSSKGNEAADCLERRIRDAAEQAQDIIESLISSQIDPKDVYDVWRPPFQKAISLEGKVNLDLKKMKEEVDSIVEEVIGINESYRTEALQLNDYSADIGASKQASTGRNTIVGFDEHLTTIKAQLCGESSKLHIVPIVGMGGIGKTTLARNIFDDDLIVYHFHIRVWVTVSQNYHMHNFLLSIRDSINETTKEFNGVSDEVSDEELREYVYKHLKGMRYLIIMDDIWSTQVLDDVQRILPDDCNGSRVVLTTRLSDVAVNADTFGSLHQMQFLNEEQSWNLLREKVFAQEHCPPELEVIGKLIANNCRGLPLAIVVVAGLLCKINRTPCDWKEIAGNVSLAVTGTDDHFSKILTLSYNHLPHHLKACFLYIGGFPEDHEISVSKLTNLWIAEGFLKPVESKCLEEVADEYLEDLVGRNLVLITKKRSDGKFKFCSIHDLLRDLCTQRARTENFFHVMGENDYFNLHGIDNTRRLYLHYSNRSSTRVHYIGSHVRSILFFQMHAPKLSLSFAWDFRLLRVLDAVQKHFLSFPIEIVKLFHLRYLALQMLMQPAYLNSLPPSISKLHNLQTLIIVSASISPRRSPISLPSEIWNMPQLRHVMISQIMLSSTIPYASRIVGEDSVLKNLQTLSTVVNFRFSREILEMIPNLKKLKLLYTEGKSPGIWQQYCLNNLVYLCQLEDLTIKSDNHYIWSDAVSFPKGFVFSTSLKKLSLFGCRLPWKDLTAVGSLPNLEVLKLKCDALEGEEWEPIEGEFLRLKYLSMEWLNLKHWQAEDTHFPSLEHLKIMKCRELEEIPPGIGEIPTLEVIEVYHSKLAADSAILVQEEQQSMGNDVLQVRVYT